MALVACGECGKEISDKAAACPNCGAPGAAAAAPSSVADPKVALRFAHPRTGKVISVENAAAWALVFGFFYFALRGPTRHAIISFGAAFLTWGVSWFVYPFFAQKIVRECLLEEGWVPQR